MSRSHPVQAGTTDKNNGRTATFERRTRLKAKAKHFEMTKDTATFIVRANHPAGTISIHHGATYVEISDLPHRPSTQLSTPVTYLVNVDADDTKLHSLKQGHRLSAQPKKESVLPVPETYRRLEIFLFTIKENRTERGTPSAQFSFRMKSGRNPCSDSCISVL